MKIYKLREKGILSDDDIRLLSRLDASLHGSGRDETMPRVDRSISQQIPCAGGGFAHRLFDAIPTDKFAILVAMISGASVAVDLAVDAIGCARAAVSEARLHA